MSNARHLDHAVAVHEELKSQLRTVYGEDLDEEALLDTLEGETDVVEIITGIVRQIQSDKALLDGIKAQQDALARRKERISQRAERLRNVALNGLEQTGRKKIEAPDFTVSLSAGSPSVVVTDEAELPGEYVIAKITHSPDKKKIGEALKGGAEIPGASLSNPTPKLTIRSV